MEGKLSKYFTKVRAENLIEDDQDISTAYGTESLYNENSSDESFHEDYGYYGSTDVLMQVEDSEDEVDVNELRQ